MIRAAILSLGMSCLLTPLAFAEDSSIPLPSGGSSEMNMNEVQQSSPGDINVRLVPQIGVSSLEYSGGNPGQAISGGVTTELGASKARLLETGVLLLRTSGTAPVGPNGATETVNTSEIAIPLMAKLRFIDTKSQSWYFKVGALTDFQVGSDHGAQTQSMDVLGSVGFGARVPVSGRMDWILEATYNRGFISALETQTSTQEGILFFSGLSIGI